MNIWESDPENIKRPYSEKEKSVREMIVYSDRLSYELDKDSFSETRDTWGKTGVIKALYDNAAEKLDIRRMSGNFTAFYCIGVHDDGSRSVIMKITEDDTEDGYGIGETWEEDTDVYTGMKSIMDGTYDSSTVLFEEVFDPKDDEFLYVAYAPVYVDGKLRYVVYTEYDWTSFARILRNNLSTMVVWGFAGMFIADIVLILFIYYRAVRPVTRVNDGVREYMESKNSSVAAEKMQQIHSENEIGVLADSFSELTTEIDRYTEEIRSLTGERERVAAELSLATNIQASQLPGKFPAFPERNEFDIYASMVPAKEVGGDFYDFFLLDDDHLGLVIADVSGKGVPAAMFMMISKLMIKNFAMSGFSPGEVLEKTNENIFANNKEKMFVTVWLGILEISTGKLTAANAGHEYPVLRQPDGKFELLKDKHGFVIGIRKNRKYTEYELKLQKGATLFVYTDGVPEATNNQKELYGKDRMLEALNNDPSAAPGQLIENVHKAVNGFVGDAPQFDDLTMLAITIK